MTSSAPAAPVLDGDPFSIEILADPIPFDTALREAGPLVWLAAHGVSTHGDQ